MNKLEINMRMFVKGPDKDGNEEIMLRIMATKFRELLEIVGRGNLDVETTYSRPTKNRRPSERRPKSRRSK